MEAKMVDLPQKKVGLIACSGEELPEGTISRLAALKVLEHLRSSDTVTICLPLFLAGGEGDRTFARFYPTIAIDGCEKRCAARATEMYSGKPASSLVISQIITEEGLGIPEGRRRLNVNGRMVVDVVAEKIVNLVDNLIERDWSRRIGTFTDVEMKTSALQTERGETEQVKACACSTGIPAQNVIIDGKEISLIALPLIYQQFKQDGKLVTKGIGKELLDLVKIYNPILVEEEKTLEEVLAHDYAAYLSKEQAI
jgi:uncharacterized metal-binding protein